MCLIISELCFYTPPIAHQTSEGISITTQSMLWAGLSVEGVSLVSGVEVHDHSPTESSQPSVLIEDKWQDVSGRDTSCLVPRGPWLRAMELIGPKCTLLPGPGFVKEDHTSCYCRLEEFPPRSPLQFGVSGPQHVIINGARVRSSVPHPHSHDIYMCS